MGLNRKCADILHNRQPHKNRVVGNFLVFYWSFLTFCSKKDDKLVYLLFPEQQKEFFYYTMFHVLVGFCFCIFRDYNLGAFLFLWYTYLSWHWYNFFPLCLVEKKYFKDFWHQILAILLDDRSVSTSADLWQYIGCSKSKI